jgi:hypothetical protein
MPRRIVLTILALALTASPTATAFHVIASRTVKPAVVLAAYTRRSILQQGCAMSIIANRANAYDVIRSPGKCANGEGEGCDSLADNNELIRSLQTKSAQNRESNQRVSALEL